MTRNRIGVVIALLVIIVVAGGAVYVNSNLHNTMQTMQFIESRIKPNGTFTDYDQAICVNSVDDIGWFQKGKNWYIQYGKLRLEFTPENLRDQKFLEQIKKIHIDIRGNLDTGDLKFYWQDEELKPWIPS